MRIYTGILSVTCVNIVPKRTETPIYPKSQVDRNQSPIIEGFWQRIAQCPLAVFANLLSTRLRGLVNHSVMTF